MARAGYYGCPFRQAICAPCASGMHTLGLPPPPEPQNWLESRHLKPLYAQLASSVQGWTQTICWQRPETQCEPANDEQSCSLVQLRKKSGKQFCAHEETDD